MKVSNWLVIYDIRDPKRLHKVAKEMESWGKRVQYSVFEVLADRDKLEMLRVFIRMLIKPEDSVFYFELCEPCWQKQIKIGPGKLEILSGRPYYIL